jgi:hypothetical protein
MVIPKEWQQITMVKKFMTLVHGDKLKNHGILTPENVWYCSKLPWYFYNITTRCQCYKTLE